MCKSVGDEDLNAMLTPGMYVRHPNAPEWGLGQVQSNIGGRVTVNFENEGKVVIDGRRIGRGSAHRDRRDGLYRLARSLRRRGFHSASNYNAPCVANIEV